MANIENRLTAIAGKIDKMAGCKMFLTLANGQQIITDAGGAIDLLYSGAQIIRAESSGPCGMLCGLLVGLADTTNDGGIEP